MQVTTTFRHMEQSDALKAYAEEKLDRVAKYIDEPINVQVYFTVEKKIRHIVEIVIAAKGISTKASEATNDMYAAFDAVSTRSNDSSSATRKRSRPTSLMVTTEAVSFPKKSSRLKASRQVPSRWSSGPRQKPPNRCRWKRQ